jgi:hypothetical protein
MKREAIIEIAVAFDMLTVASREPENWTHDDDPPDPRYHDTIRSVCTFMCDQREYPTPEARTLTIDRLIQYVHDNISAHDRDDDVAMIVAMCDIIQG